MIFKSFMILQPSTWCVRSSSNHWSLTVIEVSWPKMRNQWYLRSYFLFLSFDLWLQDFWHFGIWGVWSWILFTRISNLDPDLIDSGHRDDCPNCDIVQSSRPNLTHARLSSVTNWLSDVIASCPSEKWPLGCHRIINLRRKVRPVKSRTWNWTLLQKNGPTTRNQNRSNSLSCLTAVQF